MADLGEESVAVMLRMTESLMLAPATDLLKYCLDAIGGALDKAGGAATHTIKVGATVARDAIDNHGHSGQVSMKRLVADAEGAELVSIPIEAADLREAQTALKHYGVTFAIMEHPSTGALTAHFKAKSVDQVTAALKHIIEGKTHDQEKSAAAKTAEDQDKAKQQDENEQSVESADSKKDQTQSQETPKPEWLEIGDQELCEMNNLVLTVDNEGMTTITAIDEKGGETEVFAERCPIPTPVMAKSFALTQAARFKGKNVEELKELATKKEQHRPTKEVLNDARERATKRNEELGKAPKEKSVERSEPSR